MLIKSILGSTLQIIAVLCMLSKFDEWNLEHRHRQLGYQVWLCLDHVLWRRQFLRPSLNSHYLMWKVKHYFSSTFHTSQEALKFSFGIFQSCVSISFFWVPTALLGLSVVGNQKQTVVQDLIVTPVGQSLGKWCIVKKLSLHWVSTRRHSWKRLLNLLKHSPPGENIHLEAW